MAGTREFIRLPTDQTGKRVDAWFYDQGGVNVYAQAMVQVSPDGDILAGVNGLTIQGNAASDAPVVGNPLQVGGRASTATPSAVSADGDAVALWLRRSGALVVDGYVASGATDAGNPVKVGGVYSSTLPTFTDGQRADLQLSPRGALHVSVFGEGGTAGATTTTPGDGVANQTGLYTVSQGVAWNGTTWDRIRTVTVGDASSTGILASGLMAYNGSTWDRVRGNTSHLFVGGNVASGATDAGNPVKVGGVYNSTLPTLTTGQRGDIQADSRARLIVRPDGTGDNYIGAARLTDGTGSFVDLGSGTSDARATSEIALTTNSRLEVFNGSTWDRVRTLDAVDPAPNVRTGVLAAGVGPGFDIKLNPSNLATAANSAITNTVDGADLVVYAIGTSTSGTFTFEMSSDDSAWVAAPVVNFQTGAIVSGNITPTSGDIYAVRCAGARQVRIRTVSTLGVTVAVKTTHHLGSPWQVPQGNVAHDDVDSGLPVKIGGFARTGAIASPVADADRVNAWFGPVGQLRVQLASDAGLRVGDVGGGGLTGGNDGRATSGAEILLPTGAFGYVFNGSTWDRIRGNTSHLFVGGNVASGATDSGNPVKIGGVYNSSLPTLTNGQRGEAQVGTRGSLNVTLLAKDGSAEAFRQITFPAGTYSESGTAAVVAQLSAYNGTNWNGLRTGASDATSSDHALASALMAYNGATWDRVRGNTSHLFVGGNIASGVTDAGNPVKVGGIFSSSLPTLTTGQRGDLQVNAKGLLLTTIYDPSGAALNMPSPSADGYNAGSANSLAVSGFGFVFNGSTWDRVRGDTQGLRTTSGKSSTSTVTQVASSASSVTLKASNAARVKLFVFNDSTQVLYLKLGATASTTSFTLKVDPQGYWELPGDGQIYTGTVDAIWASANGNAYVTELT